MGRSSACCSNSHKRSMCSHHTKQNDSWFQPWCLGKRLLALLGSISWREGLMDLVSPQIIKQKFKKQGVISSHRSDFFCSKETCGFWAVFWEPWPNPRVLRSHASNSPATRTDEHGLAISQAESGLSLGKEGWKEGRKEVADVVAFTKVLEFIWIYYVSVEKGVELEWL